MSEIPDELFEEWFQHFQDRPWGGDRFEAVMAHNRIKLWGKPKHHDLYPFLWRTHEYEEGILGDDGKRRFRNQQSALTPGKSRLLMSEFRRLRQEADDKRSK